VVEEWPVKNSLLIPLVRELTVFGDDATLYTTDVEGYVVDPGVGGEYGEIPRGTKYIWHGGRVNTTTDPDIRELWLAHGFEVDEL
jgi:hypothetical protein